VPNDDDDDDDDDNRSSYTQAQDHDIYLNLKIGAPIAFNHKFY
jgi:hypothetical protein